MLMEPNCQLSPIISKQRIGIPTTKFDRPSRSDLGAPDMKLLKIKGTLALKLL